MRPARLLLLLGLVGLLRGDESAEVELVKKSGHRSASDDDADGKPTAPPLSVGADGKPALEGAECDVFPGAVEGSTQWCCRKPPKEGDASDATTASSSSSLSSSSSSPWRCFPSFLVIGAQKSGTTALMGYLLQHPRVRPARSKELHYFDKHSDRGALWCERERERDDHRFRLRRSSVAVAVGERRGVAAAPALTVRSSCAASESAVARAAVARARGRGPALSSREREWALRASARDSRARGGRAPPLSSPPPSFALARAPARSLVRVRGTTGCFRR
jgi:hypothetical protein